MRPAIRNHYNQQFSTQKYQHLVEYLNNLYNEEVTFRIAETPMFIDKKLKNKVLKACEQLVDVIVSPEYKKWTQRAVPPQFDVPNETAHTDCIAFDFAICKDANGELTPQLIELQGFPTLFAFQAVIAQAYRKFMDIPKNFDVFLGGYTEETYLQALQKLILGSHTPSEVILMDVLPHQQKTRVDFNATLHYFGVKAVGVEELRADGTQLYYVRNGVRTDVKRIYNRLIFDDLSAQTDLQCIDLMQPYNVEWVSHPNWFYRISKFTLPFLKNEFVPDTQFLSEVKTLPDNLSDYVLKPLFSFSGMGVIIDVTPDDIAGISDPENWILQRKVTYEPVIEAPNGQIKAELRIIYFWNAGEARPVPVCNLGRMSRGKMIGTRYNKDFDWVGGNIAFFEND